MVLPVPDCAVLQGNTHEQVVCAIIRVSYNCVLESMWKETREAGTEKGKDGM